MSTMKPGRLFLPLAVLLAFAVSGSALAQHQGRGGRGQQQQQQQQQQQAQRPMMPPSQGAPDASFRRGQPQQQHGRMSDEERQQLRRDISDHGRDIYRDRSGGRRE
jgi:hemolysin activation/secretion protein